jgi:hypothetical protein
MFGDTKSILSWVPSSKANPLAKVIVDRKIDLLLLGKIFYVSLNVFRRRRATTPETLFHCFSPHQSLIHDLDLTKSARLLNNNTLE